ncbi:MAG: UDP-N-acetylmuramate--L-alanine ligase [Chloroflexota bacterium]
MKDQPQLTPEQHIHFIGIAGTGLSAIARILLLRAYVVTGSDLRSNKETEALQALGATIYQGHDASHVANADIVIRSSAVPDEHIEVVSARAQNIPVYKRSDVMATIMAGSDVVAVAGTHGKTTTTSMISHILLEADTDPSYIIGGVLANTGFNANAGQGKAFVIEADEYDNMFHGLNPNVAVVTSVEFDHPDFFKTPQQLVESFSQFIERLPDDGLLVVCADDAIARQFAQKRKSSQMFVITYSIDASADWRAVNIRYENSRTLYDVIADGELLGTVSLGIPGQHNILNSLASLIVAQQQGISFAIASEALSTFRGAGRRFDVRADINNIVIVDDYAHHPTAIRTTIDAARQRYPHHTLWTIWQPHTFSRTHTLWEDYTRSFDETHYLIVTDIYSAREHSSDFPSVTISALMDDINHPNAHHFSTFDEIMAYLVQNSSAPAVILIMSAGDAPEIGIKLLNQLEATES